MAGDNCYKWLYLVTYDFNVWTTKSTSPSLLQIRQNVPQPEDILVSHGQSVLPFHLHTLLYLISLGFFMRALLPLN